MSNAGEEQGLHRPVLVREVLQTLAVRSGDTVVDATVGCGGHAAAILEKMGGQGRLLGIDRDEEALAAARRRLARWGTQVLLVHGNFVEVCDMARARGIRIADGVILDLGVSSLQLDSPRRGFSLLRDGPLDMRMDASAGRTAADLVNELEEAELRALLLEFGEERNAGAIARAVVRERSSAPIRTTARLALVVEKASGGRRGRLHPATRTFQALRIAVNDELSSLERGLSGGLALLRPGGRMAVISFHSLEDRIVKRFFARHVGRWESLQAGGRAWRGERPAVTRVSPKPLTPSAEEIGENQRSRSAKLRAVERVEEPA